MIIKQVNKNPQPERTFNFGQFASEFNTIKSNKKENKVKNRL